MNEGQRKPKYQQIADPLRQAIRSGEYGPGDRLPAESALMEQYGVARMTVRHALGVLQEEGLTESRKGSGVFVCDPLPGSFSAEPVSITVVGEVLRELDAIQAAVDRLRARLEGDSPQ